MPADRACVVLDVDGTLYDTTYHHALAWYRAFLEHDIVVPVSKLHRHIGMGGDQLVPAVTSDATERAHGDDLRAAEKRNYLEFIDETRPFEGATELLLELKRRGNRTVLSTSAKQDELDHYLEGLGARDLVDAWTSAADVDRTKPHPDLVHAALDRVGGGSAVMVGDSTWDCEAAGRAGIPCAGVLTGGFSACELSDAGAIATFASLPELRGALDGVTSAAAVATGGG
jgi:HAD superfamily hydrolase (TIGR01509 family)